VSAILSVFTNLQTLVLFVATFTVIVAVHEFGHFAAARLLGMKVLEFAFGFPPRLAGIRRGETEYTINWIPFGGFVRILGQDDFSIHQQGTGDPRSFTSKPWWAQAIVLAAGVFMNFVLAILILTVAFMTGTTAPTGDVRVFDVRPGSPAAAAGLQVGDIVVDVDGTPIHTARAMVNITAKAADKQQEISIDVTRAGQPVPPIKATPRADPPAGEGPLGVPL
jgi:regulator of sigma E protease